jgi:hypothetical protein
MPCHRADAARQVAQGQLRRTALGVQAFLRQLAGQVHCAARLGRDQAFGVVGRGGPRAVERETSEGQQQESAQSFHVFIIPSRRRGRVRTRAR